MSGLEILLIIILIITWWIWVPGILYLISIIIMIVFSTGLIIFSLLVSIWDWIVDKLTK